MKRLFILAFIFSCLTSFSQEHAWIYFNDKPNQAQYMSNPLSMLSQRALDRRTNQSINLDITDVPVHQAYINQINNLSSCTVLAKSKWLNAVHVYGTENGINQSLTLPFVSEIEFASNQITTRRNENLSKTINQRINYNYGGSSNQVDQIGLTNLHLNDHIGTGMQIAVLDAGFPGVDVIPAFADLRASGRILGTENFVDRIDDVYLRNYHGTRVLSTMAGIVDNELIGTAPDASYYLFITEDAPVETPLEESLWVEAAEKADSLGVDIINTSLGYQDFDEAKYDHTYQDFDGETTFITRGANFVAQKGMILVVAAGNDGTGFHYIGAPADAHDVLTVGAVDENGDMADFSSYGPSADGRIKPDVCAKGLHATIADENGNVTTGSGTSYASPILCGAVASLWSAFPMLTNYEIMQVIRESAHLYQNPEDQYGYGIPNFSTAFTLLKTNNFELDHVAFYPNPVKDVLHFDANQLIEVTLFDNLGKKIGRKEFNGNDVKELNVKNLTNGIYFVKINNTIKKMIKKD